MAYLIIQYWVLVLIIVGSLVAGAVLGFLLAIHQVSLGLKPRREG